jgi:hypothetical protein
VLTNLNGTSLVCNGHQESAFKPTGGNDWNNVTINLPGGTEANNVRFKIEFTATDFLNNFFIDDFNVSGLLTTKENGLILQDVSLYPNPSAVEQDITLSYYSTNSNAMQVSIYDMVGNSVFSTVYNSQLGMNTKNLNLDHSALSKGVYNVVLNTEGAVLTKRLVLK